MYKKQNPGSKEAVVAGCTCPVLDNAHGAGAVIDGVVAYWYAMDCPIHRSSVDFSVMTPQASGAAE